VRLGAYAIVEPVGRGGAGTVYRGRAPDGADVAVKVVTAPTRPGALGRFGRERRLLADLGRDAGFVPVLDEGEGPQGPFLVMPFLPGGTLEDRLRREGRLDVDAAVDLARTLGQALGRAHARGVVHRDLKPANVLFDGDGRPLVADLGLAKHFGGGRAGLSQSLSRTGEARGTVGYMPPEQLADAKSVGPAADVFALAAVLYECLAGAPALSGGTPLEVMEAAAAHRIRPLRERRPGLPAWLVDAVHAGLAADPARRPPDGAAFAARLTAPAAGPPRSALVAAGVLLAGAATAAGVVLFAGPGDAGAPPPAGGAARGGEPGPGLPEVCAGFRRTARTRLASVWGEHRAKQPGLVLDVAVDLDRRRLASVGGAGAVFVWAAADGRELGSYAGARRPVAVTFAAAGERLVAGEADGRLRQWDVASGRRLTPLRRHPATVEALIGLPEGRVASGDAEGTVLVHDLTGARAEPLRLDGHAGEVVGLATTPGGDLVSAGADGALVGWDLAAGAERWRREGPEGLRALAAGPPAEAAALALGVSTAEVWGLAGPERRRELPAAPSAFAGALLDGARALLVGLDGTWTLAEPGRAPVRVREGDGVLAARNLAVDVAPVPGGAVASAYHRLEAWDVGPDAVAPRWPPRRGHDAPVTGLVVAADGATVFACDTDGVVRAWEVGPGRDRVVPGREGRPTDAYRLAAGPDGRLALASTGGVELLDPAPGEAATVVARPRGRVDRIADLAWAPSGDAVFVARERGVVEEWTLAGERVATRLASPERLRAVAVLERPEGRRTLVAGGDALLLQLVALSPAEPPGAVTPAAAPTEAPVASLAPAGLDRLLVGRADGVVEVWTFGAGAPPNTRLRHGPERVEHLAVRGDLAASGAGGAVALWDLARGVEVDRIDLASSTDRVASLALDPGAEHLYVGTARGVILRFALDLSD